MKKKAFTLLELIITLAITGIVLGVIYTFFLSSTKTIVTTEIRTDLQKESQDIQDAILKYGTEANKIIVTNSNKDEAEDTEDTLGKIDIKDIVFKVEVKEDNKVKEDNYKFEIKEDERKNKILYLTKNDEDPKVLSTHIKEFQIRPLDYRMKSDESNEEDKDQISQESGIEVSYVLNIKKGYSDVSVPGSIIVKFRNKK